MDTLTAIYLKWVFFEQMYESLLMSSPILHNVIQCLVAPLSISTLYTERKVECVSGEQWWTSVWNEGTLSNVPF